ncbi:MAG: HNH endonuclease [Kiritimatiellae bacterium]|nr:HNH endonuclease [Kiritimatiellia bacterium]
MTARKAVDALIARGLVERRAGVGLFVRDASAVKRAIVFLAGNLLWEPAIRAAGEVRRAASEKGAEVEIRDAHGDMDEFIRELKAYFTSVIDWIDGVFKGVKDEMCGLEWGRLYETYRKTAYNPERVWRRVEELYGDEFVTYRRGIFEYVLGGEKEARLLNVRVFSDKEKKQVYARQTADAEKRGVSNCPLCAVGHEASAKRIWKIGEMGADHVTAWSKGGATDISNCQMLCKTHNRAKGNR